MNLILGIIMVVAGIGLFLDKLWAQITALILAVLSIIANLLVLAAYPIWSVIVIAVDVLVIYAICMHGDELRDV